MAEKEMKIEDLKFEEALDLLQDLVTKMESGNVPLEKLIGDFEQGSRLVALCRGKLDAMERKIELLTRDDGDRGEWRDFTPGETPERSGELPF